MQQLKNKMSIVFPISEMKENQGFVIHNQKKEPFLVSFLTTHPLMRLRDPHVLHNSFYKKIHELYW